MSKIATATAYIEANKTNRTTIEEAIKKVFNGWNDLQEIEIFLKYSCGASNVQIYPNMGTGKPEVYAERWQGYDEDGNDVAEVICDIKF